jgi:inosine-uridine nucleoside N-ribohydrolase
MKPPRYLLVVALLGLFGVFSTAPLHAEGIRVLFDSDANNELDDQHALAYLLFNGGAFEVEGIAVNRTKNGGDVRKHREEAERVVKLCNRHPRIKVYTGANGEFEGIKDRMDQPAFDGYEAVNLIIKCAHATDDRPLVLLPVGKLTTIALALKKDPTIIPKVRVVWLGSNYPEPGEYNQVNDEPSLNYILDTEVDFEIATVRYGKASGTDAVRATLEEIKTIMPGKGPLVDPPVIGRHGKSFACFGDYSVNLFENIRLHGDPPSRALFDMAAVAIVKNPDWAAPRTIPAPILRDGKWVERPDNSRKIILWESFDRKAIMQDFYNSMKNYQLAEQPKKLIYETDMCLDVDDVGGLAMLHAMADGGEVEILAVTFNEVHPSGAAAIDAINTWYGRGDIPVGIYKENLVDPDFSKYLGPVAEFPHDLTRELAPTALEVYLKVLAEQPDKSVTIVSVGFLNNIYDLLKADPDLVAKKVKELVVMGGRNNDGFNLVRHDMAAQSEYVLRNWPTPLVISQHGGSTKTGAKLSGNAAANPVREAFYQWFDRSYEGRSSWDQVAVLYGVRGLGNNFREITTGKGTLRSGFQWRMRPGHRSYLEAKLSDNKLADTIESLMIKPPKPKVLRGDEADPDERNDRSKLLEGGSL